MLIGLNQNGMWTGPEASAFLGRGCGATGREAPPNPDNGKEDEQGKPVVSQKGFLSGKRLVRDAHGTAGLG